jgi:two-component system sensor histidine kinase BarA
MKRLGIKYQILLITLIPVFLIDVFFTYIHFGSDIAQANELLQSKGQIIAKQLAGASEFNLISGNDRQIQRMLEQTIDTNSIIRASVFDKQGKPIAESESKEYQDSNVASYLYYRYPIMSRSTAHPDVFAPDQVEDTEVTTIGWVHLYISHEQLEVSKAQITRNSIVFFVIVLVLSVILTVVISRRITQPIFTLVEHMKNVETGRLGETIEPLAFNEIGAVQKGFNRMTQALLSNRKQLNKKIQAATQQLSEAITDMETKNRELGFARDEAQNANRIKSEFLANMSHEIRTPINGIKGFISLISQSSLNSTQKKYADIVLKSTNDLTNIINEILDFSKIESGKLQIVDDDFDLHEVIEQTRDTLFITILAKNIDLNLIIYSDTPRYVCGDKLRIKQILLNLIGNAIKFTDVGEVVIKVSVEEQTQTEVIILITIEDTGIGISDENQASLFTAFSQVEAAANRRFAGTGLGLAISKNLVSLMGGTISLQREVGKGSKFSVRLPLALSNTSNQEVPEQASASKTAMIIASRNTCLQELQSLYDRAGITTEPILLEQQAIEQIRENIHRNRKFIDYLVIDFRHLDLDSEKIVDTEKQNGMRIIAMHYDPGMIPDLDSRGIEFISVINTSKGLQDLLDKPRIEVSEEEPGDRQPLVPAHRKNVLFVDDNEINLKLGSELIQMWGHQVCEANHANEAMIQYRKQSFDLIILDIQMPDIDGVTLQAMMRDERPDDQTPIAALTANIMTQEADRLLELGFDYYLSKPIDEEKFHALLDGTLGGTIITPVDPVMDQQYADTVSVDFKQSLDFAANNESLLQQIFGILLHDIPHHKDQLTNAARQLDYAKLSRIAHKIHGITCYTSLPQLKMQVASIQQQLAQESYSLLEVTVDEMIEELEQIRLQIKMYLQQAVDDAEYSGNQELVRFN